MLGQASGAVELGYGIRMSGHSPTEEDARDTDVTLQVHRLQTNQATTLQHCGLDFEPVSMR